MGREERERKEKEGDVQDKKEARFLIMNTDQINELPPNYHQDIIVRLVF